MEVIGVVITELILFVLCNKLHQYLRMLAELLHTMGNHLLR